MDEAFRFQRIAASRRRRSDLARRGSPRSRCLTRCPAAAPRCHRLRRPPSTRREKAMAERQREVRAVPPPEAMLAVCFATPVCSHVRGGAEDPLPKHFRTPLPPYRIRVGILATSHSQPRYHVMCTTRPTPGLALGGQSLRLPDGSHSQTIHRHPMGLTCVSQHGCCTRVRRALNTCLAIRGSFESHSSLFRGLIRAALE